MCKDTRILRTIANCAGLSSRDQGALHRVADRITEHHAAQITQRYKENERLQNLLVYSGTEGQRCRLCNAWVVSQQGIEDQGLLHAEDCPLFKTPKIDKKDGPPDRIAELCKKNDRMLEWDLAVLDESRLIAKMLSERIYIGVSMDEPGTEYVRGDIVEQIRQQKRIAEAALAQLKVNAKNLST